MSFEQASATSHWYSFLSQGQVLSRTLAIGLDRMDVFLTISGIVHLPAIALVIVLVLSISPTLSDPTADQFLLTKHHARVMIVVWTQIFLSKYVSLTLSFFLLLYRAAPCWFRSMSVVLTSEIESDSHVFFSFHIGVSMTMDEKRMVTIAGEAGMVRATGDIYAGRTPEWYPSLRSGLRNMFDLLGATLLVYGAIMAVVGTLTAMVWLAMNHIFSMVGFLFLTFAVLVTCVGIVTVCYIWITTIPLYPIIVMEEKGPINALRRCVELTKGRASYFSVGVVLLWICQFVLGQFLHYIFNGGDTASFVFKPAGILVGFLPGLIYVPLDTM